MITRIAKITVIGLAVVIIAGASAYFTLTLIIKSEDTVIVPDLIGKDVVTALELLTELELNTKVKGSEYNADIAKNHVILQEPEAGSEIKKGRDVRIVISKGPKTIILPNLTSLSVGQARIILEENGLCQGDLSYSYDNNLANDTIIAQDPTAGRTVMRGDCVNLLISQGNRPKAYKMPDLAGLSLDKALLLIEKANLSIGEVSSGIVKHKPRNTIVDQDPLSGYPVFEGSQVNLVINRTSVPKVERLLGQTDVNLFHYQLGSGFLNKHIRVELSSAGETTPIFEDYLKPAEELWLLIPTKDDTIVRLYENDTLVKTEIYEAR